MNSAATQGVEAAASPCEKQRWDARGVACSTFQMHGGAGASSALASTLRCSLRSSDAATKGRSSYARARKKTMVVPPRPTRAKRSQQLLRRPHRLHTKQNKRTNAAWTPVQRMRLHPRAFERLRKQRLLYSSVASRVGLPQLQGHASRRCSYATQRAPASTC